MYFGEVLRIEYGDNRKFFNYLTLTSHICKKKEQKNMTDQFKKRI